MTEGSESPADEAGTGEDRELDEVAAAGGRQAAWEGLDEEVKVAKLGERQAKVGAAVDRLIGANKAGDTPGVFRAAGEVRVAIRQVEALWGQVGALAVAEAEATLKWAEEGLDAALGRLAEATGAGDVPGTIRAAGEAGEKVRQVEILRKQLGSKGGPVAKEEAGKGHTCELPDKGERGATVDCATCGKSWMWMYLGSEGMLWFQVPSGAPWSPVVPASPLPSPLRRPLPKLARSLAESKLKAWRGELVRAVNETSATLHDISRLLTDNETAEMSRRVSYLAADVADLGRTAAMVEGMESVMKLLGWKEERQ